MCLDGSTDVRFRLLGFRNTCREAAPSYGLFMVEFKHMYSILLLTYTRPFSRRP